MKKEYIAPDLHYELFTLSQSIATCSDAGKTQAEEYGERGYFASASDCTKIWDDSTNYEGYCYWSGSIQLFLS